MNGEQGQKVRFSELGHEEVYALMYALAETDPDTRNEATGRSNRDTFTMFIARATQLAPVLGFRALTPAELKQHCANGLAQLAQRGLIAVEKDGMGAWRPRRVLLDRIDMSATGALIIAEGN